ncbi:hypothetical protein [Plantactinospora sp. GCM10030261]|uniref:hypothetical protein n=1 Tax=Plantactinospora sp. GCM10030261 TaxID=3273420 RepID=UPI00361CCFA6
MELVAGIDRSVEFGQPQLHAVQVEQRREVAELVAVERSLELANDHRVELPARVRESCQ